MKEWAEADNQSKNLPKTERQALNEVSRLLSSYFIDLILSFKISCGKNEHQPRTYSFIFPLLALPVCAADTGGAGRWREAEAGGDSPRQS